MAKRRIHLTESQLYGLVEQALNELDWKTYDWAREKVDNIDINDYSNPSTKKAIIRALSKKYGRKNIAQMVNGMSDDELKDFMKGNNDNKLLWNIGDRELDLKRARNNAFARKYGHHNMPYSDITIDTEGNFYEIPVGGKKPKIYPIAPERVAQKRPFTSATPFWSPSDDTENPSWEHTDYIYRDEDPSRSLGLTQTDAARDLLNHYTGNSRYTRGEGWNESIARKVTESVMRKLRRM